MPLWNWDAVHASRIPISRVQFILLPLCFVLFIKKHEMTNGSKKPFKVLQEKTVADQIVVERVVPKLRKLNFCKKIRLAS